MLIAYSAAFILAYLSWKYIEIPSRRFKQIKFRYTVTSLVLLPILMIHTADYWDSPNALIRSWLPFISNCNNLVVHKGRCVLVIKKLILILSQNDICKADINGVPVYRDAGHITDYASYQFGFLYLQKFANPLT